jgi:hypothetical protein
LSSDNQVMNRRDAIRALMAGAAGLAAGCGYSLSGRGSFLPDYIKTIGVPTFTNRTTVFNLETTITEKVRSEFISRGNYQIQTDTQNVDAVLTGEVTGVNIAPTAFANDQLGSQYSITMTARAELRDARENKILWENPGLNFRQEFPAVRQDGQTGAVDANLFFNQDANALERMTSEFARAIVSAILEAF